MRQSQGYDNETMSNFEPPHTPGDHDPLIGLELFEMDPKVRGIMAAMRQAQTELQMGSSGRDILDHDDEEFASRVGCGKLNGYVLELGLLNDTVALYGKVRLAPWLDDEDRAALLADPFFREVGIHKGSDHHGEYWQLADHQLRMALIDTDRSEGGALNPISYIMTLRTEQQARLIEEEQGDIGMAGGLMIYPDDVEYMRPTRLSDRYVEQLLMTNYPDLYGQILELLPGDGWYDDNEREIVTDAVALERLARLEIPATLSLPADFRESLSLFLFNRLTLDPQSGHVFRNYASLEGLNDDGQWVPHKGKKRKLRGNVIAVDIDPTSHHLSYVVTELARDSDAGVELRKIPATSDLKVRSSRPVRNRFARAAMWQFDTDESALQWFNARNKQAAIPESVQFVELIETVDITGIKEYPDRYEVSIDGDLAELGREFSDHHQAVRDIIGDREPTFEDMRRFPTLEKRVDVLGDVTLGRHVGFTGGLTIGLPDPEAPDRMVRTMTFDEVEKMTLHGTVVDFCGAWFAAKKEGVPDEFALAAVIRDPMLMANVEDDQGTPLDVEIVMVRLDDVATKGYRIVYKNDLTRPAEGQ